jgi:hypothetical protein
MKKNRLRQLIQIGLMIILTLLLIPYLSPVGEKPRSSFQRRELLIDSIKPGRKTLWEDSSKYRLIYLQNERVPVEIFIGKSKGDFVAAVDNTGQLKPGDSISAYFSKNPFRSVDDANRHVFYIDRGDKEIYVRGAKGDILFYMVAGLILLSVLLIRGFMWSEKRKKRP